MNQEEFVQKVREVADNEAPFSMRISDFADYVANYVATLDLSRVEKSPRLEVEDFLPQIIVGAVNEIRRLRADRPAEHGLNVTDFDRIDMFDRDNEALGGGAYEVGVLVQGITGSEAMVERVDKVLRPDWHAIHAAFFRFLDAAYSQGLYQEIRDSYPNGVVRKVGQTRFGGRETCDRIIIWFGCGKGAHESKVTFMCDTDDPHGFSGGLHSQHADLATALAMIDAATTGWKPRVRTKRAKRATPRKR